MSQSSCCRSAWDVWGGDGLTTPGSLCCSPPVSRADADVLCGFDGGDELGGSGGLVEEADVVGAILSIPSSEVEGGLKYPRRVAEGPEGG